MIPASPLKAIIELRLFSAFFNPFFSTGSYPRFVLKGVTRIDWLAGVRYGAVGMGWVGGADNVVGYWVYDIKTVSYLY